MTQVNIPVSSKATEADFKYYKDGAPVCNRSGFLQVDDNPPHKIHWAEYGKPAGEPVMFIHGGPGGGCTEDANLLVRFFDPDRYRVIFFDQRGCGKSRPSVATDGPQVALQNNTTDHLVGDIFKLRHALNITSKMHVFGGSWGSTLGLAYSIKYPETVETRILRGVFIGRSEDLQYMYQGNAATYAENPFGLTAPGAYITFPDAWKQFVEIIQPEKRADMMKAYKEIFDMNPNSDNERKLQLKAAVAWSVWEGAISYLSPTKSEATKFGAENFAVCFAQIEAHYFANDLFLSPGHLMEGAATTAHIPTHIVHGTFDQVCPLTQAETLVAALRKAGVEPNTYIKTIAGHSMMERENYLALAAIMDGLPRMPGI